MGAASSPLAAAAAVAASAGATVGFSAVVDGVVAANPDTSSLIQQNADGQTILPVNAENDDANKPCMTTVKKALVDYDSDEDEDDGDDVCEDEDAVEDEKNKIEVEDGPLSSPV